MYTAMRIIFPQIIWMCLKTLGIKLGILYQYYSMYLVISRELLVMFRQSGNDNHIVSEHTAFSYAALFYAWVIWNTMIWKLSEATSNKRLHWLLCWLLRVRVTFIITSTAPVWWYGKLFPIVQTPSTFTEFVPQCECLHGQVSDRI